MSIFSYKFARFIILGLLLLVGVGSDPAVMNSDSSDDDSMVVAVEMKLVEPYQTANSDRLQSSAIAVPLELDTRSALAQGKAGRTPATVSSPLVVPLRT